MFRLVYRLQLTDTHLRLRAPLWTTRVPLAELTEISTAASGRNMARIRYGTGRTRTLLAGPGLVNFLERVGQAAPDARIEISGMTRHKERISRLFSRDADPDPQR
ncbi:hypothetical protein ACFY3U_00095 [Micromonospora sp. NPDC000089]|uniref:hypothetical protein n=1 Tax=unclassified Micromonospora TaxID=2617518 RepID=UPI00367761AE